MPQLKHMFDSKDISHVVENFKICAGDAEGDFDGTVFGDGDFYKWMESAIYTAYQTCLLYTSDVYKRQCKYMGITPDLYDPIEEDVKAYLRGE